MKTKIIAGMLLTALLAAGHSGEAFAQQKKAKQHVKAPPQRPVKPIKARPARAPLPPSPPPPPLPPQP